MQEHVNMIFNAKLFEMQQCDSYFIKIIFMQMQKIYQVHGKLVEWLQNAKV